MGADIDAACGQLRKRYGSNYKAKVAKGCFVESISITDIGLRRKTNQDFVFVSEEPVGKLPNLFIVADGMVVIMLVISLQSIVLISLSTM